MMEKLPIIVTLFVISTNHIKMKKLIQLYLLLIFGLAPQYLSAQTTDLLQCPGASPIKEGTTTAVPPPNFPTVLDNPPSPPPTPPPTGDDRLVVWVHGLGGNEASWERASAATQNAVILPQDVNYPTRKVLSHSVELSTFQNSLSTTGSNLYGKIEIVGNANQQSSEDRAMNIVIAHSQGGLVSRYADYFQSIEDDQQFGGLVTFGTPHQGAQIVNNKDILKDFLTETCDELVLGPATEFAVATGNNIQEFVDSKPFVDLVINEGNLADVVLEVTQKTITEFCGIVDDAASLTVFAENDTPISEDYTTGSAILEDLNNFQSPIPKVAFYGVEPADELIWTTLYYLSNDPNTADYFSATNDFKGVETAQTNFDRYEAKFLAWYTLQAMYEDNTLDVIHNYTTICEDINGVYADFFEDDELAIAEDACTSEIDDIREVRRAWQKGRDWWLTANERFKIATGAVEIIPGGTPVQSCTCEVYSNGSFQFTFPTNPNDEGQCEDPGFGSGFTLSCYQTTIYSTPSIIEKESDGIVLAESAAGLPGADAVREMPGSSHMQMRNDRNLMFGLNDLWDGDIHPFFQTEEK